MAMDKKERGCEFTLKIVKINRRSKRGLQALDIKFNPRVRWPYHDDKDRFLEFGLKRVTLCISLENGKMIPGSGDDFASMKLHYDVEISRRQTQTSVTTDGIEVKLGGGLALGSEKTNSKELTEKYEDFRHVIHPGTTGLKNPSWIFRNDDSLLEGQLKGVARLADIQITDFGKFQAKYEVLVSAPDICILRVPVAESRIPFLNKLVKQKFVKIAQGSETSYQREVAEEIRKGRMERVDCND